MYGVPVIHSHSKCIIIEWYQLGYCVWWYHQCEWIHLKHVVGPFNLFKSHHHGYLNYPIFSYLGLCASKHISCIIMNCGQYQSSLLFSQCLKKAVKLNHSLILGMLPISWFLLFHVSHLPVVPLIAIHSAISAAPQAIFQLTGSHRINRGRQHNQNGDEHTNRIYQLHWTMIRSGACFNIKPFFHIPCGAIITPSIFSQIHTVKCFTPLWSYFYSVHHTSHRPSLKQQRGQVAKELQELQQRLWHKNYNI